MPTILDFAGITFTPESGYELDGVSHHDAILSLGTTETVATPRDKMVYNMYYNISWYNDSYQQWPVTVQFAVRNQQYKLMNHDVDSELTDTYFVGEYYNVNVTCKQIFNPTNVQLQLYDLLNDPNETTNLYDNKEYSAVQDELWQYATEVMMMAEKMRNVSSDPNAYVFFDNHDKYILPWDVDSPLFSQSSLQYCNGYDSILVPDSD